MSIYSNSLISIKYSVKDHFPLLWTLYPDRAVEALRQASETAVEETKSLVPYDPTLHHASKHLRDSAVVQVYKNGSLGGTCYVQWQATSTTSGYHYGIVQEFGGTHSYTIHNYTTPGTGPGFMDATWTVIQELVPEYVTSMTTKTIKEVSI